MKGKNKRRRWQKLATLLLCGTLCASNVMSQNLYVYAEEFIEYEANVEEQEEELITDNSGSALDENEIIENPGDDSEENEETESPGNESDEDEKEEDSKSSLDDDEIAGNPEDDSDEDGCAENTGENSDEGEIINDEDRYDEDDADDTNQGEESDAEYVDQQEETANVLVMAEINNIASGSYTEDGSNLTWVIDSNGKLTVSGTGEFAPISTVPSISNNRQAPWRKYSDDITSASIKVTGMTDASCMLDGLWKLTEVDLSGFDASSVTNMARMFERCENITSIDLSSLDTSNVTDMFCMFNLCFNLKSLNLGGKFSTENVTNFRQMFASCWELETLDLSNFNTEKATTMQYMFSSCLSLKKLDLRNFDTSNVEGLVNYVYVDGLNGMFSNCESLTEVNLSSFKTPKVTSLNSMFYHCKSLTKVDLSSFDTRNVMSMISMFEGCSNLSEVNLSSFNTASLTHTSCMFLDCSSLEELDLSNFDLSKVWTTLALFNGCTNLSKIKTPYNYNADEAEPAVLPKAQDSDVWYQPDGTEITNLPKNLSYSITITRNEIPEGPHIEATKTKIEYECGDMIAIDDLTVTWYDKNGAPTKLDSNRYTTNVGQLDTKTPGKRMLTITYVDDSGVTYGTTIELMVTLTLNQLNTSIELPEEERIYNKKAWSPVPTVNVTIEGNRKPLNAETDYTVDYSNNVNVGTEAMVIIKGINDYKGEVSCSFTIGKAEAHLIANDMILAVNDELPQTQDYSYEVTGLIDDDSLISEPTFKCDVQDTSYIGTYTIIPENADAGNNYTIIYHNGILKVAEERVIYTVTFNLMGHEKNNGVDIDVKEITDVKSGSVIDAPIAMQEGDIIEETREDTGKTSYVFTGWYKDTTFVAKQKWSFDTDTVQDDTTLYACWLEKGSVGDTGLQFSIQEIQDQYYTGSAIKPTVYVYTADGKTLLKSGKDYTIKYANNTEADTEAERTQGGIGHTIDDAANGFSKNIAYVIITGKGNYRETIYKNFHILPAEIATKDGNVAAGVTLKYSDQLVINAKKAQNPLSSLKYKKAMKLGQDFMITLKAEDDVKYDTEDEDWSKHGNSATTEKSADGKKYITPAIPKGYSGTFTMTVEGRGNYTGTITKTVVVAEKERLMKNASISLGKDIKSWSYDKTNGKAVTLTPGYMVTTESKTKEYYAIRNGQSEKEENANSIFLVKVKDGKMTRYLRADESDFFVSYTNNIAVGTATMTITGNPEKGYYGFKNVTFKIVGTAFNTKNVTVVDEKTGASEGETALAASMLYTGRAVTQNKVTLKTSDTAVRNGISPETFIYGKHYTISYKNNIKKGTATMTFTAKPESGYTGSIKKTFKITPQSLLDADFAETGMTKEDPDRQKNTRQIRWSDSNPAIYSKNGAELSFTLRNADGIEMKLGTDYTVSYKNNKTVTENNGDITNPPILTIKGKGNYAGILTVTFRIQQADIRTALEEGTSLTVSASSVAKKDNMQFKDFKFKILDGKKALSDTKDYTLDEANCTSDIIKAYAEALEQKKAGTPITALEPKVKITGIGNYIGTKEISLADYIYVTKLTGSTLYVVISEETYTGAQIIPKEVTVYYGDAADVKKANRAVKLDETALTTTYKLTKLTPKTAIGGDGDYTLTYGANNTAGKNKGSMTITGAGMYGGSVTVKFEIHKRNVYSPSE